VKEAAKKQYRKSLKQEQSSILTVPDRLLKGAQFMPGF
jgi:hypothetical protein